MKHVFYLEQTISCKARLHLLTVLGPHLPVPSGPAWHHRARSRTTALRVPMLKPLHLVLSVANTDQCRAIYVLPQTGTVEPYPILGLGCVQPDIGPLTLNFRMKADTDASQTT